MSFRILLVLGGFLALATAPLARAQDARPPATYPDTEAAKHAGEQATVTGTVVAVSKSGKGTTYLNFGSRFPNHLFSGVVFASDAEKVGDVKTYEGKAVAITGRIDLAPQDQKPQIIIRSPDQIRLTDAVATIPPPTPPAPMPESASSETPAPPKTAPAAAPPTAAPPPAAAPAKRIMLGAKWNSPTQRGEMTRKDLALLFGSHGAPSEETEVKGEIMVYPEVPMLTPLAVARKTLRLENVAPTKSKVTCAGLPADSFTAHAFSGIFPGGYSRIYLVTDTAEQVVSVLLVDENTRQRASDLNDAFGYHTYNFINNRVKANNELVVKHEIATTGAPAGVVLVDTLLVDANDPEDLPPSRGFTSRTRPRKPTTGRVLERSRWFVPQPMVNLILRCVGSR